MIAIQCWMSGGLGLFSSSTSSVMLAMCGPWGKALEVWWSFESGEAAA